MSGLDVYMIGPFPTDEHRIEGGIQASLYGLARELSRTPAAEGDVARLRVIATPNRVGGSVVRRDVAGIDATFLTAPRRFLMSSVANVPTILAMLGESDVPLVHLHGSGLFEMAMLAACLFRKVPVVWTMHGITEKETLEAWRARPGVVTGLRHLLYRVCERLQLRMAPDLVVDTPYVAREVAPRARAVPQAIPQGIFLDELAAARAPRRDRRRVVSIGVIHPRKGHRLTIEAFADVVKRVPDAHLTVIGSLFSTEHLAELRATIAAHGLDGAVDVRTDLDRADVLAELAEARVFALHSEEESQGIALCEAMAVGLPIVSTTAGGIPDVLADSGAGFLVAHGDVRGFAEHIVRLLTDDRLAAETSARALARGADFDWHDIARRIVARYRLAVERTNGGAETAGPTSTGTPTPLDRRG